MSHDADRDRAPARYEFDRQQRRQRACLHSRLSARLNSHRGPVVAPASSAASGYPVGPVNPTQPASELPFPRRRRRKRRKGAEWKRTIRGSANDSVLQRRETPDPQSDGFFLAVFLFVFVFTIYVGIALLLPEHVARRTGLKLHEDGPAYLNLLGNREHEWSQWSEWWSGLWGGSSTATP